MPNGDRSDDISTFTNNINNKSLCWEISSRQVSASGGNYIGAYYLKTTKTIQINRIIYQIWGTTGYTGIADPSSTYQVAPGTYFLWEKDYAQNMWTGAYDINKPSFTTYNNRNTTYSNRTYSYLGISYSLI